MGKAQSELQRTQASGPCPGPSPDKFFEARTAYQHTAALKATIELDLFTAIGDGQTTGRALATKINGSERGVRILCDCLAVMGKRLQTHSASGHRKRDARRGIKAQQFRRVLQRQSLDYNIACEAHS
jgi:hypothetical protein